MKNCYSWCGLEFWIYAKGINWFPAAGIYIFAKPGTLLSQWTACYIGETENFAERIPSHERWEEARRLGASCVHIKAIEDDFERKRLERRLIEELDPPLNDIFRL